MHGKTGGYAPVLVCFHKSPPSCLSHLLSLLLWKIRVVKSVSGLPVKMPDTPGVYAPVLMYFISGISDQPAAASTAFVTFSFLHEKFE